jgi:starch synthase
MLDTFRAAGDKLVCCPRQRRLFRQAGCALQLRFALLCLAALEAPLQLPLQGSLYGEDCIFIANDWHAAMTPIYLAAKYRKNGVYKDARSVLAIHNLRHQGVFPPSSFNALGLPGDWYKALEWQYPPHQRQGAYEEEGRAVNTLKVLQCPQGV